MIKLISFISLVAFATVIFGQNSIDSLKQELKLQEHSDNDKVDVINQLALAYINVNNDSAIYYANISDSLSEYLSYEVGKAKSQRLIGVYNFNKSNYDKAIEHLTVALELFKKHNNENEIAVCYNDLGLCYKNTNKNALALENLNKSIKYYEKTENELAYAQTTTNIGIIYFNQGNYALAQKNYYDAMQIFETLNDKRGLSYCLNGIGVVYRTQGNLEKALQFYEKSLNIKNELNDKLGIASCYISIGNIHKINENKAEALSMYQNAKYILDTLGHKRGIAMCIANMAELYKINEDYNKSIDLHTEALGIFEQIGDQASVAQTLLSLGVVHSKLSDYQTALKYYNKCFEIADVSNNIDILLPLHEQYYNYYNLKNNYKKALDHFKLYNQFKDSLFNKENAKAIADLELKYSFEKERQSMELEQEKALEIHEFEIIRQKNIRNFIIVLFVLMVLLSGVMIYSYKLKQNANRLLKVQKEIISEDNLQLKELNATKNKFFSIIAHDLRSPLGSLYSLGELLWNTKDKADRQMQDELIEALVKDSKRTFDLLDNLLKWAKSSSGRIDFNPETVDITSLVMSNIDMYNGKCAAKEISLLNLVTDDLKIHADYNMLDTVLRNLVSNAIKFTPNKGKIEITASSTADNKIALSVSDNGVGIPQEHIDTLFNMDSKFRMIGTNDESGSGLGLKLCKEFIDKNGGEISVSSELGEGTTFTIILPKASGV